MRDGRTLRKKTITSSDFETADTIRPLIAVSRIAIQTMSLLGGSQLRAVASGATQASDSRVLPVTDFSILELTLCSRARAKRLRSRVLWGALRARAQWPKKSQMVAIAQKAIA